MKRILTLIAALCASPAAADVEFDSYQQFQTRFGLAQVVGERGDQGLAYNGQRLPLEPDWTYEILGAYAAAGSDHDWLFASHHHGGNMCGPGITIMRVSASGLHVMGETHGCAGAVRDLNLTGEALELVIYDDGMRQQHTTYRATAQGMIQIQGEDAFATFAAAGGVGATRWVGQHPYEIFRDPTERARFLAIMTRDEIRDLASRIGPANTVLQRGDWVLGAGCMAHACNISGGVWGIRVSDGTPAAAMIDQGGRLVPYGAAASDPVFQGWINEHRL